MDNIQFVVFDYDGVFSDGKCHFDAEGNVHKFYDVKDGMALGMLKKRDIKIGLISSYRREKPILIQNQLAEAHLIDHLGFDYVFIGKSDKKKILEKWLTTLELTMENVAYIGDDINDVVLQKEVGYSGCPNNSVEECKEVVNYICKNNGGNGAIREFVETILNPPKSIFQKMRLEVNNEIMYQIRNLNEEDIINFVELIKKCDGNIYTMGIGKSGNMAKHFADLLKSISIQISYLDTINALHGDIGSLNSNDYVFLFSKSGNTHELLQVLPFLKQRTEYIYGICCENGSHFERECKQVFVSPFQNEISGEINKIPTNSYMSHLLFANHVVSIMKNDISLDAYKNNHPAGSIGSALKKVKDVLIKEFPRIVWRENIVEMPIVNILLEMTQYNIGCCVFLNENQTLIGILVDGDIRRLLLKKQDLQNISKEDIKKKCVTVNDDNVLVSSLDKHYKFIPLLNALGQVSGLVKL